MFHLSCYLRVKQKKWSPRSSILPKTTGAPRPFIRSAAPAFVLGGTFNDPVLPSIVVTVTEVPLSSSLWETLTSEYRSFPSLRMVADAMGTPHRTMRFPGGLPCSPCSFSRTTEPSTTPGGTLTVTVLSTLNRPHPLHLLQRIVVLFTLPRPSQSWHFTLVWKLSSFSAPSTASCRSSDISHLTSAPGPSKPVFFGFLNIWSFMSFINPSSNGLLFTGLSPTARTKSRLCLTSAGLPCSLGREARKTVRSLMLCVIFFEIK
mmetsp:Transcript_7211/g.13668  ORF Transcript_7211/g.13668 Transcript_7211/m.13668 type:complete len:261 (-) Transcript_7211:122-904(-)